MNTMTFETYPDMMIDYERNIENEHYDEQLRYFTVPEKWGNEWIGKFLEGVGLENLGYDYFVSLYTWDDTWQMYEDAVKDGVLVEEHIESRVEAEGLEEQEDYYCPSATGRDYSPSNPWNAPGMSVRDFI